MARFLIQVCITPVSLLLRESHHSDDGFRFWEGALPSSDLLSLYLNWLENRAYVSEVLGSNPSGEIYSVLHRQGIDSCRLNSMN